jgi:hypothetical protein
VVHLSAETLVLIVVIFDLRGNAKSSRAIESSVGRRELRNGHSGLPRISFPDLAQILLDRYGHLRANHRCPFSLAIEGLAHPKQIGPSILTYCSFRHVDYDHLCLRSCLADARGDQLNPGSNKTSPLDNGDLAAFMSLAEDPCRPAS